MDIDWSALLFGNQFMGQSNNPFESFLRSTTCVATVGHSAAAWQAHDLAISDLPLNNWSSCAGFLLDERKIDEFVARKVSQTPGLNADERQLLRETARLFAIRSQAKNHLKNAYVTLLQQHYQTTSNRDPADVDWQALLYGGNPPLFNACDKIAQRIFWDETLAMQATEQVIRQLQENDWQALKNYQGKGSADGYFKMVFRSRVQDFFGTLYGTCQPKVWIRNAGLLMEVLFKKLCCEKIDKTTLAESYRSLVLPAVNTDEPPATKQQVMECCRVILQKEVNCQKEKVSIHTLSSLESSDEESDGSLLERHGAARHQDDIDGVTDWENTLIVLGILAGETTLEQATRLLDSDFGKEVQVFLQNLDQAHLKKIQLTPTEKLVLQCRYLYGMTYVDAAAHLSAVTRESLVEHKIRYEEKKALEKLRKLISVNPKIFVYEK